MGIISASKSDLSEKQKLLKKKKKVGSASALKTWNVAFPTRRIYYIIKGRSSVLLLQITIITVFEIFS